MSIMTRAIEIYQECVGLPPDFDAVVPPTPAQTWRDAWHYARAERYCAEHGHQIVDDSYGGPDSGCVDLHCTRCGFSHYVQLY